MKKLLLASAIAAISLSAQAAPTIYGKAFITLDAVQGKTETTQANGKTTVERNSMAAIKSRGSRLGIKGKQELSEDVSALYNLEYRLDIDDNGRGKNFSPRDTYLGLSSKTAGTVMAGNLLTVDAYVDYADIVFGSMLDKQDVHGTIDGQRLNNSLAYISPKYSDVQVLGIYSLDEKNAKELNVVREKNYGVAARYEPKGMPFKAGASFLQNQDGKAYRVSGSYAVTPEATVGALYQVADLGANKKKESFVKISGSYKLGNGLTPYAQVNLVKAYEGKNINKQRLVVGTTYEFNKNTFGHLYAATMRGKDITDKKRMSETGIGAGFEYKF